MLEFLSPGDSLSRDLLWQPCLFLGAGLGATFALGRRPARAHRFLVLAMLASFSTPLFCQAIRRAGLGVLHPRMEQPAVSSGTPVALQVDPVAVRGERAPRHSLPDQRLSRLTDPERAAKLPPASLPTLSGSPIAPAFAPHEPTAPRAIPSVSWRQVMLSLWLLLSFLATARLVASFLAGLRLVRRATMLADPALGEAARSATARMGLHIAPQLVTSPQAQCPLIWCWGRRPLLLIPDAGPNDRRDIDWVSVLCHELAHWQRADHLAGLVGQIVVCVLPWNPLAWWAKSRLAQLGELACDDWVLASGLPGTDYAESLLALVPQRGGNLALAAVSSRGGLVGRVRHILDEHHDSPIVGARWGLLTAALMVLAASAVALAQARPALPLSARSDVHDITNPRTVDDAPKEAAPVKHTIRGTVLGPDGKPARDVTVLWAGNRKPVLPYVALPKDDDRGRHPEIATLARAQTDAQGRFSLSADFDSTDYIRYNGIESLVVAMTSGAGMVSRNVKPSEPVTELSLQLPPETLIHGRLLTPSGQPAAGVRVALDGVRNAIKPEGMYVGLQEKGDAGIPPYWPRSRTTGKDGRFTIEGMPQGSYVTLSFWHPDFAVDEVTVNTTVDGMISADLKGFEIVPVKPSFTHALEPARPVQGRVTDKQTGKPLAGIAVEMVPMRRHGGMPFWTRTDADGRFRISGHQTDQTYYTTVYPPASSGYLDAKDIHQGWPTGAKFLEVNFALKKGHLVSGRVIDKDTKQAIAGAAVVYQPARKNPNNSDEHDFRNTVLTDPEGKFIITALSGKGILAVETPDESYVRTPTKDTSYRTAYPQGHLSIDVPEKGDPSPVEIPVRKGVTLEARVVGPDGKLVKDVTAMYQGIDATLIDVWNSGRDLADGILRIPGADPEKTYRVFFVKPQDRLGTVAKLKFDPAKPGPVEVRLQPTATIRGKLVNHGGSAAQGGQVMPMLIIAEGKKKLSRDEMFDSSLAQFYTNVMGQRNFYFLNREADSQGEFLFEAMIPGADFYLSASAAGRVAQVPVLELKPGEVRDLGTITLKESRQ